MNFLRTCILFLMLYLIFEKQITVGQFFSLLIYSFFIFGPLQELGNVINIYRETEASLANFEAIFEIPVDPKPASPVARRRPAHARVRGRQLHAPDGGRRPRWPASRFDVRRGRDRGVRRAVGLWEDDAGQAARRPLSVRRTDASSTTASRATAVDLDRFRERIGLVTQDAQLFSGIDPREPAVRAPRCDGRPSASTCCARAAATIAAQPRRQGTRHRDRRGRDEDLRRREAAPLDRARAAPRAAPPRVRRGDVVARLAHRGGDQPHDARRRRRAPT